MSTNQELETVATIHILRSKDGKYGADCTVYDHGMDPADIPAEYLTLDGICARIAVLIAAVLRRRSVRKVEPYTPGEV